MMMRDLSASQLEWFINHFADTKNQKLAEALGTSLRSVTRIARELGLWKSKEFMSAMQHNASEHGAKANRLTGGNAGARNLLIYGRDHRFKAGESNKDRMSAEDFAAMHRRIGESRKETFKKERRRVIFGLEQQTNLRVVQCPKEKVSLRLNLRKRGYEIPRASNEATVTNETRRSIRMEERAIKMGIKFNFNQVSI